MERVASICAGAAFCFLIGVAWWAGGPTAAIGFVLSSAWATHRAGALS